MSLEGTEKKAWAVVEKLTKEEAEKREHDNAVDVYHLPNGQSLRVYNFGFRGNDSTNQDPPFVDDPRRLPKHLELLEDPRVVLDLIRYFQNRFKEKAAA